MFFSFVVGRELVNAANTNLPNIIFPPCHVNPNLQFDPLQNKLSILNRTEGPSGRPALRAELFGSGLATVPGVGRLEQGTYCF